MNVHDMNVLECFICHKLFLFDCWLTEPSDHLLGYAKNVKARFRELQEKQRPLDYVEHKPSGIASKVSSVFLINSYQVIICFFIGNGICRGHGVFIS